MYVYVCVFCRFSKSCHRRNYSFIFQAYFTQASTVISYVQLFQLPDNAVAGINSSKIFFSNFDNWILLLCNLKLVLITKYISNVYINKVFSTCHYKDPIVSTYCRWTYLGLQIPRWVRVVSREYSIVSFWP